MHLRGEVRLSELLTHLYVLIPVLDAQKHYWVGDAEVEKLLARGEGWLPDHPERELIVNRYLRFRRSLAWAALEQLLVDEDPAADDDVDRRAAEEEAVEEPLRLNEQRHGAVAAPARADRAVPDGADISRRAARRVRRSGGCRGGRAPRRAAAAQLRACRLRTRAAADYRRHDPESRVQREVEGLPAGKLRHPDHRFEWTRAELETWAGRVAAGHGYGVRFVPIGPEDPVLGAPTQMAVFDAA